MTHNLAALDAWQDEFTQLRHHLHEHPELGLDTVNTAQLVAEKLRDYVSRGTLFRRPIFKIIRRNLPLFRRFFLRFDDFSIPILHYIPATVSSHRNRPADADLLTVLS